MSSQQEINYLLNDAVPFDVTKVNILAQVVSWMESGDGNKINNANQILTKLKCSKNLFSNINQIMSNCTHTSTLIYSLVSFEQQLNNYWHHLSTEQKQSIKQYFSTLFTSISPTDDSNKTIIFRKVKSIVVKMFILDFSETDTFIENLIEEAKGDQFKCQNILQVFSIMGDEVQIYGFFFLEKKYEQILTLAAMVLKSTQQGKIKNNLLKNAMNVLQKFCSLLKGAIFPHQIVLVLLEIFKSNKLRIQICNLLSVVCSHSLQILMTITQNVSTILDWNCSIEAYRNNIKAKANNQLTYTDLFLRAYTNLILNLVHGFLLLCPANMNQYLKTCYGIIMCLSQSSDKDTWQTCRQAWITYLKISTDLINLQYLSNLIVFKCQTPLQLSKNSLNHFKPKDDSQKQEEDDQVDFSNLLFRLASIFSQSMYNKIWQFIESQTFVKFNKDLFISSTFAFCYLNKTIKDKNKIMNFLKLLMNISESVEVQNKKTVVTQFLNVVSFYPFVISDNFGLSTVLEDKYIENAQDSIKAFVHYTSQIKITPEGIIKIQNKIQQLNHQQLSLQQLLWQIILKTQSNSSDLRLPQPLAIPNYLSTLLRNYAGFKVFSLTWNTRWDIILQIIYSINSTNNTISSTQKKYLSKVMQTIIKLLQLYCDLCVAQSVNLQNNLIAKVFESVKNWKGYQRLAVYIS